jgi:hypothetical protein
MIDRKYMIRDFGRFRRFIMFDFVVIGYTFGGMELIESYVI